MRISRRRFLDLAAGAVVLPAMLPAMPRIARSDAYPARPVRMVVGFPASNASDIVARLAAEKLSQRLGQSFVVENRPGAAGNIGVEFVVNATPDGYTLLAASASAAINASLYNDLHFNFLRDTTAVAGVAQAPYLLVVNPAFPATSVAEFIAYIKANPGKINMASAGTGSLSHLCGALFMNMAGIDMVHVPYRTSFLPDLLAGQVQVVFSPISQSIAYIRGGKLRALGVTSAARQAALPDVPALAEFVPGYEASGWYGICAPKATPGEIVDRLGQAMRAGLADADMTTRLNDLGAVPMPATPAEFGSFLAADTEKWRKVISTSNIKIE
jgi:tripartite-type tricarboxylate transporter receptor subunit TctC